MIESLIIYNLDRRRNQRRWMLRFPTIIGTPTRFKIVALGFVATTFLISTSFFSFMIVAGVTSSEVDVLAFGTILLFELTVLWSKLRVRQVWRAFEDPDTIFLSNLGLSTSSVFLGRTLVSQSLVQSAIASLIFASEFLGTSIAGRSNSWPSFMLMALPITIILAVLRVLANLLTLHLQLKISPAKLGPIVLATNVITPILASAAVVAIGESFKTQWNTLSFPSILRSLFTILSSISSPFLFASIAALAFLGVRVAKSLVPHSASSVQQHLSSGAKWKSGHPLNSLMPWSILDKDFRMVVRRGPAGWDRVAAVARIVPLVTLLGIVSSQVLLVSDSKEQRIVVLISAVSVFIFVTSIISELVIGFGSMDSDGPVAYTLRLQADVLTEYIYGRILLHSIIVCLVFDISLGITYKLVQWPGWAAIVLILFGNIAICSEATIKMVGSALRPALFRPVIGAPSLEPQVLMGAAMVNAGIVAVAGIAVAAASLAPAPNPVGGIAMMIIVSFATPIIILQKLKRPISNYLKEKMA
jgi:hypothetical protein